MFEIILYDQYLQIFLIIRNMLLSALSLGPTFYPIGPDEKATGVPDAGRVGAQSGLVPGPGWGPYGPLCFFKSDTFRVQTAPFDKITIDFCRSRRRLHDSDLPGAKNLNI